eukprot:1968422-Amphidinium_carterae.1
MRFESVGKDYRGTCGRFRVTCFSGSCENQVSRKKPTHPIRRSTAGAALKLEQGWRQLSRGESGVFPRAKDSHTRSGKQPKAANRGPKCA